MNKNVDDIIFKAIEVKKRHGKECEKRLANIVNNYFFEKTSTRKDRARDASRSLQELN